MSIQHDLALNDAILAFHIESHCMSRQEAEGAFLKGLEAYEKSKAKHEVITVEPVIDLRGPCWRVSIEGRLDFCFKKKNDAHKAAKHLRSGKRYY